MTIGDLYKYGTGLDLFAGHRNEDKIEFSSVQQRLTCLNFTAIHIAGVIASPLIVVASILVGIVVPFFVAALVAVDSMGGRENAWENVKDLIIDLELHALGGIASPSLHIAAGFRALAGAIIDPKLYLYKI